MSTSTIHILHVSPEGVAWAEAERRRGATQLQRTGRMADKPAGALDAWARQRWVAGQAVYLFDSRPLYYRFMLQLPPAAARQHEQAVALRIRQQLGLNPAATRHVTERIVDKDRDEPLVSFRTVVARREALTKIAEWQARHGIAPLWVGPDLTAIEELSAAAALERPALVVNHGARIADAYHVDPAGELLRRRAEDGEDPLTLHETAPSAAPCVFGPAGARRTEGHSLALESNGQFNLGEHSGAAQELDAVVLGGLIAVAHGRCEGDSLLEAGARSPRWEEVAQRWPTRTLAKTAVVVGCVCALAVGLAMWQRGQARERLAGELDTRRAEMSILGEQAALLRSIGEQRGRTMPIFEALHAASPGGVELLSVRLSENGTLQLSGRAKSPDGPTQFGRAMTEAPEFAEVQLRNVKAGKGGVEFDLNARVPGRGRR